MSLLADMITKEFEGLMSESNEVLRILQDESVLGHLRDTFGYYPKNKPFMDRLINWRKKAGEFLETLKTLPEEAKEERWKQTTCTIRASKGIFQDRIEKRIELVAEIFNLATRPSTCVPSECVPSEPMGTGDRVDKILEERGNEPVKNIPTIEETLKRFLEGRGNEMKAIDPIDKILEERGKVHGNSNVSGEAFARGVELLYEVGDKSNTITPYAFDGHMYAAMQCFIRLRNNPWHQDNYDDLLGYLRLAMKEINKDKQS